jgi:hypothetical protein
MQCCGPQWEGARSLFVRARFFNSSMPSKLGLSGTHATKFPQPLFTRGTEYDENKSRASRPLYRAIPAVHVPMDM